MPRITKDSNDKSNKIIKNEEEKKSVKKEKNRDKDSCHYFLYTAAYRYFFSQKNRWSVLYEGGGGLPTGMPCGNGACDRA